MTGQRRLKEKFPALYQSLFLAAFTSQEKCLINDSAVTFTQSKFSLKVPVSKSHACTHCFDRKIVGFAGSASPKMRFLGAGRAKGWLWGAREPLPAGKGLVLQKKMGMLSSELSWELFRASEPRDGLQAGTFNPIPAPDTFHSPGSPTLGCPTG